MSAKKVRRRHPAGDLTPYQDPDTLMEPLSASIISIRIWSATEEDKSVKNIKLKVETGGSPVTSGG